MGLPKTVLDLLNKAALDKADRQEYERKIEWELQKMQEKTRQEGYTAGYGVGVEDGFDLSDSIE